MTVRSLSAEGITLPPDVITSLGCAKWTHSLEGLLNNLLNTHQDNDSSFVVHIRLLQACNNALDLVKVAGFEVTLYSLGSSWLGASDDIASTSSEAGPAAAASYWQPHAPEADAAQSSTMWKALSTRLLTDLAKSVCQLPLVLQALKSGMSSAEINFPKFQKLVGFLTGMKEEKTAWHGMVFVKKRQGVHELTSMLRKAPGLAENVHFHGFTGHGAGKNAAHTAGTSTPGTAASSQGMKTKGQAAALELFRNSQGRQVLVATAAAEEGLDIPNCEFVLCYTAVESGREWTQRQGRARMLKSQFVHILERGTDDELQLAKAKREAENEYAAMSQSRHVVRWAQDRILSINPAHDVNMTA